MDTYLVGCGGGEVGVEFAEFNPLFFLEERSPDLPAKRAFLSAMRSEGFSGSTTDIVLQGRKCKSWRRVGEFASTT